MCMFVDVCVCVSVCMRVYMLNLLLKTVQIITIMNKIITKKYLVYIWFISAANCYINELIHQLA